MQNFATLSGLIVLAAGLNSPAFADSAQPPGIPYSAIGQTVAPYGAPGYDIILLAGQSNMAGRGPTDPLYDLADSRIYQFGGLAGDAHYRTMFSAQIHWQCRKRSRRGNWPRHRLRPRLCAEHPANRRVLLVPVAWGATALIATTSSQPAGTGCGTTACWQPGNSGAPLYENAIAQANLAIATAQAQYPGSRFVGTLWVQGEQDAGATTQAAYATALDALIAGFRSRITNAASSWFEIGGMVPEWVAANSTAAMPIQEAQIDAPRRDALTSYVYGAPGHVWSGDGLGIHFDGPGPAYRRGGLVQRIATGAGQCHRGGRTATAGLGGGDQQCG